MNGACGLLVCRGKISYDERTALHHGLLLDARWHKSLARW